MSDLERLKKYSKELSNFLEVTVPIVNKAKARRITIQVIEEQKRINRLIKSISNQ